VTLLKDEWLIPLGGIFLAIALLVNQFLVADLLILNFVVGLFAGLSLVLNLVGLFKMRRE
jgi:hypothetical protein